jgi:S1-C subfamily serine protease
MFMKIIAQLLLPILFFIADLSPALTQSLSREAELFEKYKNGIVTVLSDEGRGSGFVVSRKGLILTNHHVVVNSAFIQVQINDTLRVESECIARDQ